MWDSHNNSADKISGGFLNDSRNSIDGNKGSVERIENVMPVFIRHLNNSHGDLKILGSPVRLVTFIGIVRNIEETTTKISYEIEDDTDSITAFHWLASGKVTPDPIIKFNTYIRVYGYLREQNERKHVLIVKMLPILDLNELTSHMLEVTYIMLKNQRMSNIDHESSDAMIINDAITDDNISGLTKEQATVFKIIQSENDSENGIERDVLKTRVPKNILSHIDNIIDFLISEGHIYSTLTDDHFKTT
ncbi:replication protein A 32 kDa subunit-like [Nomia melanderi]|uniref:replication protein A 32 kDa subunit-like n=1 Tax=Nomia melanderi TaxID=2448451 RepID=UPI0013046D9B|nr:replication protein A 32 kDa subunit isoform X1 [Nomia melanderi]XP_031843463.1 replication protein A 32 kDa subunit isoform X1 [Nomia melanderi]